MLPSRRKREGFLETKSRKDLNDMERKEANNRLWYTEGATWVEQVT